MPDRRIRGVAAATGLFGVFLLVVMASSLWLYWRATEEVVWSQNPATAAGLVDQLMLQAHWEGLDAPDETWNIHSVELMEQFADELSESGVEATFLYRPDAPQYPESGPGRPENQFETDLITQFMDPPADGEARAPAENNSPDDDRYYYYQPIYVERECTGTCHIAAPPGGVFDIGFVSTDRLAEGDLMAVAKISLPNNEVHAAIYRTWNWFLTVAIITTSLLMIAFCIVMRFVTVRNAPMKD